MNTISVTSTSHTYNIHIGENIRHRIQNFLTKDYSSIMIVTDKVVSELYLEDVKKTLTNIPVIEVILPEGEKTKSIKYYYDVHTKAIESGLNRSSLMIALGGGVIGDLTGFVASTFMRGIDYIQVPTTILAHDSSVGGKVAINHELGKNLIGSFFPPQAVIYDVHTLKTLKDHEVRSGYAELIKEAFIADASFVNELLNTNLLNITNSELNQHLYKGINIKKQIVEADEKEANIRMFLNFGHTLAHALEAEIGYGSMTHGEAVAIGMIFALQISEKKCNCKLPVCAYIHWLKRNQYPLNLEKVNIDHLINKMKSDKKVKNNQIQMVLLEEIGKPVVLSMNEKELEKELQRFLNEMVML